MFWSWSYLTYSGLMNIPSSVLNLIFAFPSLIISYLFGVAVNDIYSTVIMKFLGFIGLFFLIIKLTKRYSYKIAIFSAGIASVLFTFHFESQPGFLSTPDTFLPFVILFSLILFDSIENNKNKNSNLTFALFIISIGIFLGTGGFAYAVQNSLYLFIIFIVLFLTANRKFRLKQLKYLLSGTFVGILLNLPWIVMTYFFTKNIAYTQYFNNLSSYFLNINKVNIFQTLVFFGPNLSSYSVGLLGIVDLYLILILSVLGSFLFIKEKIRDLSSRFVLSILSSYIFMFFIALTVNKPFGKVYVAILKEIPYLEIFRLPYTSLHYLFLFSISLLLGVSIGYLLNLFKNRIDIFNKNKYYVFIIVFIIILTLVYLYCFDYLPSANPIITTGNNHVFTLYYHLPSHVFNISTFIDKQQGLFSVAILPVTQGAEFTSKYVGPSVYTWLINNPIYTGGYSMSQAFFPESTFEYYYYSGNYIDSYNTSDNFNKYYISKALGVFGIKYIIVQGDALNYVANCSICVITPFSYNSINYVLNNSNNIIFISKYNRSELYQNNNFVPLVYGSNLKHINYTDLGQIFSFISNKTFNIQNTSLLTRNITIQNAYNFATGKITYNTSVIRDIGFSSITNFSQPKITFVQNTPTKVTAHISNATTPYYLVFRETYDPHWAAFYSNGTEVNQSDHIAVNGFANAWYMNKTGNYTVTLYYTLQTDAWVAWAVSFAALFATIGIGVYGWKESRKGKRGKQFIR